MEKQQILNLIRSNIKKWGYHVTTVGSTLEPRFVYTIGLSEILNLELIFAGGSFYLHDDLVLIFKTIVKELKKEKGNINQNIEVANLGSFALSSVDSSWSKLMMLGVFDYYKIDQINAIQIIPDSNHFTLDIPDMTKAFDDSSEPVWQWLVKEWSYAVPKDSTVVTNINALLGETITEVMRWEMNEWEMFAGAGPDVQKEDLRVVSLATILGIDKALLPAVDLEVGKGLWRTTADSKWNDWG